MLKNTHYYSQKLPFANSLSRLKNALRYSALLDNRIIFYEMIVALQPSVPLH